MILYHLLIPRLNKILFLFFRFIRSSKNVTRSWIHISPYRYMYFIWWLFKVGGSLPLPTESPCTSSMIILFSWPDFLFHAYPFCCIYNILFLVLRLKICFFRKSFKYQERILTWPSLQDDPGITQEPGLWTFCQLTDKSRIVKIVF